MNFLCTLIQINGRDFHARQSAEGLLFSKEKGLPKQTFFFSIQTGTSVLLLNRRTDWLRDS